MADLKVRDVMTTKVTTLKRNDNLTLADDEVSGSEVLPERLHQTESGFAAAQHPF
jgi:hypothetical protein